MATSRKIARSTNTKTVVGATLLVSSLLMFPLNTLSNDADQKKVQKEKKEAEVATSEKKQTEKTEEAATKTSEDTDAQPEAEEGGQSAAFNPETGEINWDCPCLGGMADGPCGEEFKEAFSCFVYSETEPKGIDCIGKFEAMRTCFKQHPEHYKEELYEDDEPVPSTDGEVAAETVSVVEEVVEVAEPAVVEVDVVEIPTGDINEEVTEQPATVA